MESAHFTKVILGSASPRRRQLLGALFPGMEVVAGSAAEDFPPELKKERIPLFLARHKADSLKQSLREGELLITADTIVWFGNEVLNKPAGREEALLMLKKLSGHQHRVYTGVCLCTPGKELTFFAESRVTFVRAGAQLLADYIEHYRPFDKAGSYGAQECLPEGMNPLSEREKQFLDSIHQHDLFENSIAVQKHARMPLIEKIDGSYFNVMGLPLVELADHLGQEFGFQ